MIIISVHSSSVLRLGPRGTRGGEGKEEEGGEDADLRKDGQDGQVILRPPLSGDPASTQREAETRSQDTCDKCKN